jgi:hypothetical protein
MPGVTSPRAYPYPVDADPIDVAGDIKALAEAVDNDVLGVDNAKYAKTGGTISGNVAITGTTTMTGTLTANNFVKLSDAPVATNDATRKDYVDGQITTLNNLLMNEIQTECNKRVAVAGDTMTGQLIIGQDPDVAPGIELGVNGRIHALCNAVDNATFACERSLSTAVVPGQPFINFLRAGSIIGAVAVASSTSVAYNTTSDRRLKQSTGDVADAADIVQALGALAYRGRWIGDEGLGKEWIFLNSQDVEPVAPFAVSGAPDGVIPPNDQFGRTEGEIVPQQLDHSALVPLLFAALSQALDRIAALEAAP